MSLSLLREIVSTRNVDRQRDVLTASLRHLGKNVSPKLTLDRLRELVASRGPKKERAALMAGLTARDIAIEQVAKGAPSGWVDARLAYIRTITKGVEFSSDLLWEKTKGTIAEPRAMGAVMAEARREGLIEATGEWEKSGRPQNHARPVAIWRRV